MFVQDLGRKVHDLDNDVLKVLLTNSAPVNTNTVIANIVEITPEHGYTAGGETVQNNAYSETAGVGKLTGDNVVITASGGGFGPFRYVVLYNSSPAAGPLIGWVDYGSAITVNSGDTFTIAWDGTNGILTVT